MNKALASNRENTQKAAGRVVSGADRLPSIIALRDLPGVAEIERLTCGKGEWLTEDELRERANPVSIALFGVTEADTLREIPSELDYLSPGDPLSKAYDPAIQAKVRAAVEANDKYESHFELLYHERGYEYAGKDEHGGPLTLLELMFFLRGVDVRDEDGQSLACLHSFSRQMIVALLGLMPTAKFTPDGSGAPAAASADEWGAALERQAREFKSKRR